MPGTSSPKVLELMRKSVRPGMTTAQMDDIAEQFIRSHKGAKPSFKGLYGFPRTLCTSINEEIVHGIPSPAGCSGRATSSAWTSGAVQRSPR